jgi:DNA-binding NarL/FixJ family response regulator
VLICTGFSEGLTAERVQALGIRAVLMKPVPRSSLARAIREALAPAADAACAVASMRLIS